MMTESGWFTQTLAFGMLGWQEIVLLAICCGFPFVFGGVILLVLYLTGTIGGRKKDD